MAKTYHITIMEPEKVVYEGNITSLCVPSEMGYMGVLADHAPLIANLDRGKITLREGSAGPKIFHSKGKGFLEVLKNNVTVLL